MVSSEDPNTSFGSSSLVQLETDTGSFGYGLIQFTNIFGSGPGQVPLGSTITSATLQITGLGDGNSSASAQLYRMLVPWTEADTWNSMSTSEPGIQWDDVESLSTFDASASNLALTTHTFDVTTSVQAWSSGQANQGWPLKQTESANWSVRMSETVTVANRPLLTIEYESAFVVNSTGDASDVSPGDGVCDTGGVNSQGAAECTLRAAIEEANFAANADDIQFNMPTTEPGYSAVPLSWTIAPLATYDDIVATLSIDATTQPGFTGDPIVQLVGAAAAPATAALTLEANNSLIEGFIVHTWPDEGLEIDGSTGAGDNNTLRNNWVGIDAGQALQSVTDIGILVTVSASGNTIEGNVVAGATNQGVVIRNAGSDNNVVIGNKIGVGPDGTSPRPNLWHGVHIYDQATDNRIGGTGAGEANIIAHNVSDGVALDPDAGPDNAILSNTIFSNGGIGIDLADDGPTPNDVGDGDSGPNDLLNFPEIKGAVEKARLVTVTYELDVPAGNYLVQVYTNPSGGDVSGGEGEILVATTSISGHPGGPAVYVSSYSGTAGDLVSAITTEDLGGSFGATSEFGGNVTATLADFKVNSVNDLGDTLPGNAICDTGGPLVTGDPECSLRAAIEEANAYPGADWIRFDIPGAGPHTITPSSSLPVIAEQATIDGTTEPDFVGTPIVVIDGSGAGVVDGLAITADNSEVRGLVVINFADDGIQVDGNSNTIAGNYVGVDATSSLDAGNDDGILIFGDANQVGGSTPADRNVVSGNADDGISVDGSSGNTILGNYVGVTAPGDSPLANDGEGIAVQLDAANNTIGGAGPNDGNVIAGNGLAGILVAGEGSDGTTIQGNHIGTNAAAPPSWPPATTRSRFRPAETTRSSVGPALATSLPTREGTVSKSPVLRPER